MSGDTSHRHLRAAASLKPATVRVHRPNITALLAERDHMLEALQLAERNAKSRLYVLPVNSDERAALTTEHGIYKEAINHATGVTPWSHP